MCAMPQADDEYYIRDYDHLLSKYISVPRSYEPFNPGTLAAGMMRGMLDSAGFPARYDTVRQYGAVLQCRSTDCDKLVMAGAAGQGRAGQGTVRKTLDSARFYGRLRVGSRSSRSTGAMVPRTCKSSR